MPYLAELKQHWRALIAAFIGLGTGFSFTNYMASIMGPYLIEEFDWSRSDFAAINSLSVIMVVLFPLVGRITDMLGVRRTAMIGVAFLPITFFLFSRATADISSYALPFVLQAIFCLTTTATVYSRIVVQYIENARGLALAIVASGPAIVGAIGAPALNEFVAEYGWRSGYLALAIFTGVAGAFALLIMPRPKVLAAPKSSGAVVTAKADYGFIFRQKAFWILIVSMLLCNLPQILLQSQLGLLLADNGMAAGNVSVAFALMSLGMLMGRFICGLAIDRYPPHIVAALCLGVPSLGLFLIASPLDAPIILLGSVFSIGLLVGAEGDLIGFLIARYFQLRIFSSVMGLLTATIVISSSGGALILSAMLAANDTFVPFLLMCGGSVIVGSLLMLLLGREKVQTPDA